MINIDGNIMHKKEHCLDLRNGLSFLSGSVTLVYCSHNIEHLYPSDAVALLADIRRVLKEGHCAGIAVPSIEHAMDILSGSRTSQWRRKFDTGSSQAVNTLFCDGQHKYGYTSKILRQFATLAGFTDVRDISNPESDHPKIYHGVAVGDEPEGSLVFELFGSLARSMCIRFEERSTTVV